MTDPHSDSPPTDATDPLAEAEEELARAEERAEAARTRAAELRGAAGASSKPDATESSDIADPARRRFRFRLRLRRPSRKAVGIGSAIVVLCASLTASGYIVWQHRILIQRQQHSREFVAAAREEVAAMMSIDPAHARENIQHTIDGATGMLKSQLEATSSYMVKNAQEAQVTTKATVEDVAVESMTANSAVLLVVTKSDTINADKSSRPTVFWRLSVNIDRDGDRLKMSKFDFIQ